MANIKSNLGKNDQAKRALKYGRNQQKTAEKGGGKPAEKGKEKAK
jgi:hypothetical protein